MGGHDDTRLYVYRCLINGERAEVYLYMGGQYAGDVDEARLIIENDEQFYSSLYFDAFGHTVTDADYDAEWTDESLTEVAE